MIAFADLPESTRAALDAGRPAYFCTVTYIAAATETRAECHFDADEITDPVRSFAEALNARITAVVRKTGQYLKNEIRQARDDSGDPERVIFKVTVTLDQSVEGLVAILQSAICPELQHSAAHRNTMKRIDALTRRTLKEAQIVCP